MRDRMRAVVKTRPEFGAELVEREIPRIGEDEVLVKVRATSICGTDVHIYNWDNWAASRIGAGALPQVMGHELAGEVVEVGRNVRRVHVGDYISAETHIPDGRDLQVLLGQQHIGERMKILGVDRDGAFAEYIAVPEVVAWHNDKSIPPEVACVQEPLGNATYAVLGEDADVAGKSMVLIGDGPIALLGVAVARAVGVTQIFLVGMHDFNLGLGKHMGADHVLFANREIDRVAYVKDHTGGFGADIVLDMAGAQQAINEGLQMLRRGGRFSAFGVAAGQSLSIDYNNGIVFKGAQVHGISGRKMFDTWYRVRNLLVSGRVDISPVITNMYTLDDYTQGFDRMLEFPRHAAKVVLFPNQEDYDAACARRPEVCEDYTVDLKQRSLKT